MRAGSVWAMSGSSGEAIAAVVRQVLSVRGPMAEDDLLGVLDADGIDLGPILTSCSPTFLTRTPSW